jgi:putative hemolysin
MNQYAANTVLAIPFHLQCKSLLPVKGDYLFLKRKTNNMENNQNKASEKFIDVQKVFAEKNPSLAKVLPGFVFSFIKRIVHEDDLNSFLELNGHLYGLDFVNSVLDYFSITIKITNGDKLKDQGRFVFAANHPLGGLEGMALTKVLVEKYGDIRVPVNDILLKVPNFAPYFSPINKHGTSSKDAIRQFDKNYASDLQMLMFPSGMVSRKIKGTITDLEWKKTFITKAIQHKRDVAPIYVVGRNSNFFYNLGQIRNFFGVKANLEMFFLPHEMFKQHGQTIELIFGDPIPYRFFDNRMSYPEWAIKMQDYVYALAKGYNGKFEDFIS